MNETLSNAAVEWASRITAAWTQTAESIIETGRILIAAKESLAHGEWLPMLASIGFDERKAQRLIEIGGDSRLSNPSILPLLPDHWTKIHDLHKIKGEAKLAKHLKKLGDEGPINGARAIMGSRQEPPDSLDFFPTPPWATRALMKYVVGDVTSQELWEPACGDGHMAEVLREYSKVVGATDVHDYGYGKVLDFLNNDRQPGAFDWIITNPPFGEKTSEFVLQALRLAKRGVAMFTRLQWLETVGRYETIFGPHPPTQIAFFAERVNLCKGEWKPKGGTATAYIWLVWVKGAKPQPPFWIPPGQKVDLTHDDDAERFTTHPVTKKPIERDAAIPQQASLESAPPHPPRNGADSPLSPATK